MSIPQYGAPYAAPVPAPVSGRPVCWGQSFDETNRECRGCSFQTTCKEEVIRTHPSRYARPYYGSPTYAAPAPVPAPVPVYSPPTPAPRVTALSVHQPVQAPMARMEPQQNVPAYGYGWMSDPLFYSVHSSPPMYRVQQPGETFVQRAAKNVALSVFESLLGSLLLAARQVIWAPKRSDKVVDVTPERK